MEKLPQFDDDKEEDDSVGSVWSIPKMSQQKKEKWSNRAKRLNNQPVRTLPNDFVGDSENLETLFPRSLHNDWYSLRQKIRHCITCNLSND